MQRESLMFIAYVKLIWLKKKFTGAVSVIINGLQNKSFPSFHIPSLEKVTSSAEYGQMM